MHLTYIILYKRSTVKYHLIIIIIIIIVYTWSFALIEPQTPWKLSLQVPPPLSCWIHKRLKLELPEC